MVPYQRNPVSENPVFLAAKVGYLGLIQLEIGSSVSGSKKCRRPACADRRT
jgi:hypothetical protein